MQQLLIVGAGAMVAGLVLDNLPLKLYPTYNYWFTSPNYFFLRIGALMIAVAAFWCIARWGCHPKKYLTVL